MSKTTCLKVGLGLALLAGPLSAMADDALVIPPVTMKGMLKTWLTAGENGSQELKQTGALVKSLRLKWEAKPAEGMQVVVQPELAGGVTLLDAYATLDIKALPGASFSAGQFKYPFGLNRMYGVGALRAVDYASINAALLPGNGWDDGAKLSYKLGLAKLDAAVFEGLGPNLATPNGSAYGSKASQDASALLDLAVMDGLNVGASVYYGTRGSTFTEPRLWSGAHLKVKAGPVGLQAEFINRDVDRIGYHVEPVVKVTDAWDLVASYERVEDYRAQAASSTRMGGGLRWQMNPADRWTLWGQGNGSGPDQSPKNSQLVLQNQADF